MLKRKILFVDDEESLCIFTKLTLEALGPYEVRVENKGAKVFPAALKFKPDLIILDFVMPDMDGSAVAFELENNEATSKIPIIFLTALASKNETQDKCALIGGRNVLAKPISTEQLIKSIEENLIK